MRRTLLIFSAAYIAVLTLILSCAHIYYNAAMLRDYIAKYIPLHFILIGGFLAFSSLLFRFSKSTLKQDLKQVMFYRAEDRIYSVQAEIVKFKVYEFIVVDFFILPLFVTVLANCFLYFVFVV